MTGQAHQDTQPGRMAGERGSALVIALLIMVIMTLLGLAFVLVGDTEARIARNQRDIAQAQFIAEGGVRAVRNWFENPSGTTSYLVPTTSQMDRTQRWVDDNNDGTYSLYSSATAPYNVIYRNGTNDPFERPYRGTPALALMGTEDHPDISISVMGAVAEKNYLSTLNSTIFSAFPSPIQQGRITEILVYSPPMLEIGGVRTRYGIATIKVTAKVFEQYGGTAERTIATRTVKAVINQAPYPASGPIQSCSELSAHGNFAMHWGLVTSVGTMDLNANLTNKVDSSVPWYTMNRMIAQDMNLDGTLQTSTTVATPDDLDHDGTLDFDGWASGSVEDPWLRFWSQSSILSNGSAISPGCTGPDCQPSPFFQAPSTFGTGTTDHSNLVQNVSQNLCPDYDYATYKAMAQQGSKNCYYYASDGPGTSTFKLNGSGSSTDMEAATYDRSGLFFFDTATNSAPVDADANGTYDNLTGSISITGGGYHTGGLIYLNANFATSGSGNVASQRQLVAPGEPYIDANGNGIYDSDEYFVDLNYPGSVNGASAVNGMRRVVDGYTRQDPSVDLAASGKYNADINLYGILYINGAYDAQGNWIYFGSVVTKAGMYANGGGGTPTLYFDERIVKGTWPPPELGLPRTIITAWMTQ